MKKIKLTQNKYTLVDDEDFEWLNQNKWYYGSCRPGLPDSGYAVRRGPNQTKIYMHKVIKNKKGFFTDHIDGDRLNNQRSNLRFATNQQNQMNRGLPSNNTTGFRGIQKSWSKWRACIYINHKTISGGTYATKEEAALAYNKLALKYFGEYARLNEV